MTRKTPTLEKLHVYCHDTEFVTGLIAHLVEAYNVRHSVEDVHTAHGLALETHGEIHREMCEDTNEAMRIVLTMIAGDKP